MAEAGKKEHRSIEAFEIKNTYGANSLFARFMSDRLAHSATLQNNWERIRTHDVDPMTRLSVTFKSDFVPPKEKGKHEESKYAVFQARSDVRVSSGHLDIRKLQKSLEKHGLDTDYVHKKKSDKSGSNGYFFVSTNKELPFSIQLFDLDSSVYTFQLRFPNQSKSMTSLDEFTEGQKGFFETLEKTMKAIYDYEDADFPLEGLVFEEDRGESSNSAFLALCPSCDKKYYADKTTDCPHCGDSRPQFKFKE